eukprot:XP_014057128.1 PREDICTED: mpv17-like protein isoform X2 [Salmo salar]
MSRAWALFKAHPYISNVVGYTTLFASADLIQQSMLGGKQSGGLNTDKGTLTIHDSEGAKLNMEGTNISTGLSVLENKEDPLENWREKFWTSYKTGVVYWSTMQALNFSLVPPVARTVFVGGITLVWTVFLCHFRQQKDDTQTKPPSH